MKILIIEDEPDLLDNMVQSLQKEKFLVETADTFLSAMDKISMYDYSCILLDINLPGGSGMDVLQEIKKLKKTDGVIIISAKDSLDDKLTGLTFGADDYLTKPFHLAELNARINAVLRRKTFDGQNTVSLKNLDINYDNRTVEIDGVPLILNRKEYDTLIYFISNKNRLITKTALAEHVWGDQTDEADNLDFIYSQIKNLRKKLKESNAEIEIQAVYGIGYKLLTGD
ncbi:response regulator [Emticicia sp. CRIBPO]|uniref:response regulator transcription factor n=1 Tax=Emticicia sp. CRIBPO TaxID=2683258 RepID=UPI001412C690|nr:response regulator transcription factor [Emticicia sp. CRIBPO]NBA89025.1 response regulator [Emticicia sp. CRIBPO]